MGSAPPADRAPAATARDAALAELRAADRIALVAHENPDGDALGSLVAMQKILTALGKDSVMFIAAQDLPLPHEYRFFDLEGLVSVPPDDAAQRLIVFLDCGNIDRTRNEVLRRDGVRILNIDHHHDNTRFGTVDYVVPEASCTAEIVWDLMTALGVLPTIAIAEALYVGLITDTGRFMYENTSPRAHVMAAELIAAGVQVHEIYRRIYEGVPAAKTLLLGRALARLERFDGGRLTITWLAAADYQELAAEESHSEGVIDHLRAVDGTAVAALARERGANGDGAFKVSLRSSDDRVDVSRIARAHGGGGHRQAAGFSTDLPWDQVVELLRAAVAAQLD